MLPWLHQFSTKIQLLCYSNPIICLSTLPSIISTVLTTYFNLIVRWRSFATIKSRLNPYSCSVHTFSLSFMSEQVSSSHGGERRVNFPSYQMFVISASRRGMYLCVFRICKWKMTDFQYNKLLHLVGALDSIQPSVPRSRAVYRCCAQDDFRRRMDIEWHNEKIHFFSDFFWDF